VDQPHHHVEFLGLVSWMNRVSGARSGTPPYVIVGKANRDWLAFSFFVPSRFSSLVN